MLHVRSFLVCNLYLNNPSHRCAGACQVGSGAFGELVWYLWLVVGVVVTCVPFCFHTESLCNRFLSTLPLSSGIPSSPRWFWGGRQWPLRPKMLMQKRQRVRDKKSSGREANVEIHGCGWGTNESPLVILSIIEFFDCYFGQARLYNPREYWILSFLFQWVGCRMHIPDIPKIFGAAS